MTDHRTPFTVDSEKRTLCDFLDYLRDAIVRKASGLDDVAVRRSPVPSGTSLLVLVKHLTFVEVMWVQWSFAGLDIVLPSGDLQPEDTTESVLDGYHDAVRRANEIIGACEDLDQRCARAASGYESLSLRWVLVHLVEETARHAGHADIIREQIDGSIGR